MTIVPTRLHLLLKFYLVNSEFLLADGVETHPAIGKGHITDTDDFLSIHEKSQLIGIMPDEVEMNFKNNNTAMNIKGFAGSFGISFITDKENNKYYLHSI